MHKNNLKWIKDLNGHIKDIISLQESKGVHLHYLRLGIDFLDNNEVQTTEQKVDTLDFIKIKYFVL